MRFTAMSVAAGVLVLATCADAHAFGRGARGGVSGPRGSAGYAGGTRVGPAGGVSRGAVHGGNYTTPRGATVQHVGGGGVRVGPAGGVHAAGGGATRVTGPGGQSVTTGHGGAARVGPAGGVSVRGGSGAVARGYGGTAAVGHRGGVAVGPYGGVGVAGSRVAVGHATGYVSPVAMRTTAVGVRTASTYPYFNRTWYAGHAAAWVAPRYVAGYNLWRPVAWASLATFCGIAAATAPVSYDYGSTVVINDDNVYVNGDSVGTAADYATQATTIADTGRAAKPEETDEWQPLGVFGMVQGDEKIANTIFQLAVNKDGVIRGSYYDAIADSTLQVFGSVDKKSQRAAWSIGEKKDIVFECGLNNLTQNETTILVHYGKERTQQMTLVRLEEPKDGGK